MMFSLTRFCFLAAISLMAFPVWAADPVMASHKAIYKMNMVSSKTTSIVSVDGQMYYDFSDSCDAYASDQKFALNYVYADEPEAKLNSQFTSHEAKNFSSYDFAVQRTKNGNPEEEFVGSTSRKPDAAARLVLRSRSKPWICRRAFYCQPSTPSK